MVEIPLSSENADLASNGENKYTKQNTEKRIKTFSITIEA